MRSSSLLVLTVFLVLGTLVVEAAVVGGKPWLGGPRRKNGNCSRDSGSKCWYTPSFNSSSQRSRLCQRSCLVKGQDPIQGYKGPLFQKDGTCPEILIRCAMLNPPNRCGSDTDCPGNKKCCVGSCGMACMNPQLA
uniref:WAP domain-containing protein n=1 Tax=Loxodonta africana TaxID=9785 RepID=G3TKN4_LOXAF